jgi:hypothetical protein
LEAMLEFMSIQKLCEGQVVMQCSWHLEKLNMIWLSKKIAIIRRRQPRIVFLNLAWAIHSTMLGIGEKRSSLNKCIFCQASTKLVKLHYHPRWCIGGCGSFCHIIPWSHFSHRTNNWEHTIPNSKCYLAKFV